MNRKRRLLFPLFLAALVAAISSLTPATVLAATDPGLGTAGNFAVLAGTTVTADPAPGAWITGQLGLSPGSAVTGFPPSTSGVQHIADGVAGIAKNDLTTAYTNAMNEPCPATNNKTGVNLGGLTLVPGVYCQTTSPPLTGTLTLDGQGSTAGVWVFQMPATTLATATGARIALINGAQPCDIFWVVGTQATIEVSTTFVGNIMAGTTIVMKTGATLNGRALAESGAVNLDTNRIIQPSGCGYGVPTYVPPPTGNILPATLGVPSELLAEIPWLLVIGIGTGGAALALVISSRRRRRSSV